MNAYLNHFLKPCLKLFKFVKIFDRALSHIRYNEAIVDFVTPFFTILTTK